MAFKILIMFLVFLFLIFPKAFSISRITHHHHHHHNSNISWWCNKTPHPEPCSYFMSHNRHRFAPKHKTEFRHMLLQITLERALTAQRHVWQFGQKCQSNPQEAAWIDCLKLYDDTILQLNRTLQGLLSRTTNKSTTSCTSFDAQTWLSTALTNIETCRSGSIELNVSDFIMSFTSNNNLSRLISNSLAINGELLEYHKNEEHNGTEEFPNWVSKHDRKLLSSKRIRANVVVAKDGSGNFRTVQAALNAAARRRRTSRFIIYVKRGVYRENIEIANFNDNIMLIGDGLRYTIITGGRSVQGGYTTYSSATAGIDGLHFIAKGITFENTAGPLKGQAVALRSASDLSVFYRCAFRGYQDTLMVHSQRQFYRECYVYGTIDFIFGNAAVVFQNCIIYVRRPIRGQVNVITAQGRNDPFQNTGISIHNSQVRAAPDLLPVVKAFKTYLGRPWEQYSRTVVIKTYLDSLISPVGWLAWDRSKFAQNTLYYGEYKNFGPASSTRNRVRWRGFHVITSPNVASQFTVDSLIGGQSWLTGTGVPFTLGL